MAQAPKQLLVQKLSIRLLRAGREPADSVKPDCLLENYAALPGSLICVGSTGGGPPKWTGFLELTAEQKAGLKNVGAFGLIFLSVAGRWFAIAFGGGFHRLEPSAIEHGFGLRVVINAVDENKLRSADLNTPDENTTTTRTQASRNSSQDVFEIDHERDLVKGLEGTPRDSKFATKVAGSDVAVLWRRAGLRDLPEVCEEVLAMHGRTDYKNHFKWIDDIRHERDAVTVAALDEKLAVAVTGALGGDRAASLHLAWPIIYNAETAGWVRYSGFRSSQVFSDLDIRNYLAELSVKGIKAVTAGDLANHDINQTDEDGAPAGESFCVHDCLVFETDFGDRKFVLSSGRWYEVAKSLATQVRAFFDAVPRFVMPAAGKENEKQYNKRLAVEKVAEWVCLDTRSVKPTDAETPIEVCDFLGPRQFIHVKDQAASSKLSHLFNQGYVSAATFKMDGEFRDRLRVEALEVSAGALGADLPGQADRIDPSQFTVIFAVLREKPTRGDLVLPFFSLVTLRQVAKRLDAIGFPYAFSWVIKEEPSEGKPKRRKAVEVAEVEVA